MTVLDSIFYEAVVLRTLTSYEYSTVTDTSVGSEGCIEVRQGQAADTDEASGDLVLWIELNVKAKISVKPKTNSRWLSTTRKNLSVSFNTWQSNWRPSSLRKWKSYQNMCTSKSGWSRSIGWKTNGQNEFSFLIETRFIQRLGQGCIGFMTRTLLGFIQFWG